MLLKNIDLIYYLLFHKTIKIELSKVFLICFDFHIFAFHLDNPCLLVQRYILSY